MWPDRVSNPGPLTYESGALLTALRDPAILYCIVGCIETNLSRILNVLYLVDS